MSEASWAQDASMYIEMSAMFCFLQFQPNLVVDPLINKHYYIQHIVCLPTYTLSVIA